MSGLNIAGVQFRRAGKIYDFDAQDYLLKVGDNVVVETDRGPSLAEVVRIAYDPNAAIESSSLKPILRVATEHDMREAARLTPEYAEDFCKERVRSLDLDMRVIKAEVQFGGSKVILYFSAPGRVDFRELVKELAGGLKSRVELKQVGARDEAKLTGGVGICGREYCCSSFLREFVPVSIKMAKNQNLALNPSKVSGGCGRLLCCLTYEDEVYTVLRKKLPPKRTRVRLEEGVFGDVIKGDILNQTVLVETDRGEQVSVPLATLEVVERGEGQAEDDWGDELDLDSLMSDPNLQALDESPESYGGKGGASNRRPSGGDKKAGNANHEVRRGNEARRGEGSGRRQDRGERRDGNRPPAKGGGRHQDGSRAAPPTASAQAPRQEARPQGEENGQADAEGEERKRRRHRRGRHRQRGPRSDGGGGHGERQGGGGEGGDPT